MLGKLIKYEFKATGRMLLPLYAAVVVVTIINKLIFTFNAQNFAYGIPSVVSMLAYVLLIGAMFVITFIIMIQRFYKNLMKDEGYLMFTLPAGAGSHIGAKLIVSCVWTILSVIVSILSIFILAYQRDMLNSMAASFSEFFAGLSMLGIKGDAALIIVEAVIFAIAMLVSSTLMIYCSISIGQLFNQHKVAASFGSYMGIYMAMQIIHSIGLVIFTFIFNDVSLHTIPEITGFIELCLLGLIVLYLVWSLIFFFISKYLLKNKLNLE